MNEHLSQEEIDTLLNGVDTGDIDTTSGDAVPVDAAPYELGSQDFSDRGRMPALDRTNERLARNLRSSMFNMLRRPTEVSALEVQTL